MTYSGRGSRTLINQKAREGTLGWDARTGQFTANTYSDYKPHGKGTIYGDKAKEQAKLDASNATLTTTRDNLQSMVDEIGTGNSLIDKYRGMGLEALLGSFPVNPTTGDIDSFGTKWDTQRGGANKPLYADRLDDQGKSYIDRKIEDIIFAPERDPVNILQEQITAAARAQANDVGAATVTTAEEDPLRRRRTALNTGGVKLSSALGVRV